PLAIRAVSRDTEGLGLQDPAASEGVAGPIEASRLPSRESTAPPHSSAADDPVDVRTSTPRAPQEAPRLAPARRSVERPELRDRVSAATAEVDSPEKRSAPPGGDIAVDFVETVRERTEKVREVV